MGLALTPHRPALDLPRRRRALPYEAGQAFGVPLVNGYFPRAWLDAPRDGHGSAARGRRPRARLCADDLPPRPRRVRIPSCEVRRAGASVGAWGAYEEAGEA